MDDPKSKSEEPKIVIPTWVLYVYTGFVVITVVITYLTSLFMVYCVLSDVIFQITLLFVRITALFEETSAVHVNSAQEKLYNQLRLVVQICWCLYSFSIVALIVHLILRLLTSFFKTMWDSLSQANVQKTITNIFKNPHVNKRTAWILHILFVIYFVVMLVCIVVERLVMKQIIYAATFIVIFFYPILSGIFTLFNDSWRVLIAKMRGRYSKYTFEPTRPNPNPAFPMDLIDPARLRNQVEFTNFIIDDRTNVYLTEGHFVKKIFGLLHVVALFIGIGIRIYLMTQPELDYSWSGLIIIAFYIYGIPFIMFCNIFSTFLPHDSFKDESIEVNLNGTSKKSFDKGNIQYMFYVSMLLYVVIFLALIVLSIFILCWERPEEKYKYKFYTKSSLMEARWTIVPPTTSTCSIDIKGMTFSQLSALPMLSYFTTKDKKNLNQSEIEIFEHNKNVILNIAFASLKERKVTEYHDDELTDGIHIRDQKLHIFVIHGLRSAIDWVLLFEQLIQDQFAAIVSAVVPFYSVAASNFRVPLIWAGKLFADATGCKFLSVEKAHRIEQQIIKYSIPKKDKWHEYTNVAVGHLTGGYFAKYLGSFNQGSDRNNSRTACPFYVKKVKTPARPNITAIGFDSYPYTEFQLEINQTLDPKYGMSVNVHSNDMFGHAETKIKTNFQRNKYPTFFHDALQNFCLSVAMCSNNRFEIDFCWTQLGDETWNTILNSYGRYMDVRENVTISAFTNKDTDLVP